MAEKKKNSMGKGLGALFVDKTGYALDEIKDLVYSEEKEGETSVIMLKTVDIEPNKSQPRKQFDQEKLETLRDSILEHGLLQPILVTPTQSGTYKIIAGERRWRASKLANLKEIPCIIRSFEEQKVMELALVENLQREDLNPIEEAEGYQQLMDTFLMTQEEISTKVGKSRSAVANILRLNNLSEEVKKLLINGDLSQGHARTLLALSDEKTQLSIAKRIVEEGLTVRQVERLVALSKEEKKPSSKKTMSPFLSKYYKDVESSLSNRFGTKVKISEGAKKGKIEIEYYSKDDLERILFELRN